MMYFFPTGPRVVRRGCSLSAMILHNGKSSENAEADLESKSARISAQDDIEVKSILTTSSGVTFTWCQSPYISRM